VNVAGINYMQQEKFLILELLPFPIVFLKGHGDIPAWVQAMKAGAVDFLTKPFDEQKLLQAIHEAQNAVCHSRWSKQ
jgi:FixJ family two-component response regulator